MGGDITLDGSNIFSETHFDSENKMLKILIFVLVCMVLVEITKTRHAKHASCAS
jgi:hypothetical protein